METNKIYTGSSLEVLKTFPDECIDMVMTSPPYWGLRDYGTEGQIWDSVEGCEHEWGNKIIVSKRGTAGTGNTGNHSKIIPGQDTKQEQGSFCLKCGAWRGELGLEPTFQLYIKHLCDIFDEVKRVLKKTGTCWVNLGDSYGGTGSGQEKSPQAQGKQTNGQFFEQSEARNIKNIATKGKYDKCLIQIPARFSIEMINRGWILRNELIWHKPNCMPISASDRFTVDFEKIFFFVKNKKYYFEQQLEKVKECSIERIKHSFHPNPEYPTVKCDGDMSRFVNPLGRNKRCVWKVETHGYSKAHFATYPEKLCITPIKAGCPEFICKKCGKPKIKIFVQEVENTRPGNNTGNAKSGKDNDPNKSFHNSDQTKYRQKINYIEKGYTDCGCNAGFDGGVVLDPFCGAGTTLLQARKQGRKYVGIDVKSEYAKMADDRIYKETSLI